MSEQFKLIEDKKDNLIIKNDKVEINISFLKNTFDSQYLLLNIVSLKNGKKNTFYKHKSGGFIPAKYKEDIENFLIMHKLIWGQ